MKTTFLSVIEATLQNAKRNPNNKIFAFIDTKGVESNHLTSSQLISRAKKIAHHLLIEQKIQTGAHVLLVYPPGLEFVEAFLGCLFAKIIPVPVPPPAPLKPELGLQSYAKIATDAKACAQLTSKEYHQGRIFGKILNALKNTPKWPALPWIVTDTIEGDEFEPLPSSAQDLAFLQYTSGSTRDPKGVMITHENLWAQMEIIKNGFKLDKSSVSVFWMPHFHDFCLIGALISGFYLHHTTILFSPLTFLRTPSMWLKVMTKYHATHTGSPDFGYQLTIKKTTPAEKKDIDLKSLKCAIVAADLINAKTLLQFSENFSECHFNTRAFSPTYGLAEHTIAVSMNGKKTFILDRDILETQKMAILVSPDSNSKRVIEFVGCGNVAEQVRLHIVDPDNQILCPLGHVGEIWIDSKSKALGYFEKVEESELKFRAKIKNQEGHWLRTGDLGFILENELVVIGRMDDMIIIDGKNYFPQDIEEIVTQSHSQIKPGRVVAFDVLSKVILLLELRPKGPEKINFQEIANAIRLSCQQELGFFKLTLVFAKEGSIAKTTSGKLQRKKCRNLWLTKQINSEYIDEGNLISQV